MLFGQIVGEFVSQWWLHVHMKHIIPRKSRFGRNAGIDLTFSCSHGCLFLRECNAKRTNGNPKYGCCHPMCCLSTQNVQMHRVADRVRYTGGANAAPVIASVKEVFEGDVPYYRIMTSTGREIDTDGDRLETIVHSERTVRVNCRTSAMSVLLCLDGRRKARG